MKSRDVRPIDVVETDQALRFNMRRVQREVPFDRLISVVTVDKQQANFGRPSTGGVFRALPRCVDVIREPGLADVLAELRLGGPPQGDFGGLGGGAPLLLGGPAQTVR